MRWQSRFCVVALLHCLANKPLVAHGETPAAAPIKADSIPARAVGEAAPPFMLKVLNPQPGRPPVFDLRNYVGEDALEPAKLVVMAFFATWCKPCKKELPSLVALAQKYRDKGLQIVSISIDRETEAIAQIPSIVQENKIVHPVASDSMNIVARRYLGSDTKLPSLVMVGRDGNIVALHQGYGEDVQASISSEIEKALGVVPTSARGKQ